MRALQGNAHQLGAASQRGTFTQSISNMQHGKKGFVIPTKSFFKTEVFCYNNKMFSSINKTFGCCSKIFGRSNQNSFFVLNFVAVTKPFFFREFSMFCSTFQEKPSIAHTQFNLD